MYNIKFIILTTFLGFYLPILIVQRDFIVTFHACINVLWLDSSSLLLFLVSSPHFKPILISFIILLSHMHIKYFKHNHLPINLSFCSYCFPLPQQPLFFTNFIIIIIILVYILNIRENFLHLCFSVWLISLNHHQFHPFSCWIITLCIYYIFFIHSSVDRHLPWFHRCAIVNSAAINMGIQHCMLTSIPSDIYPGEVQQNHKVGLFFVS
jgi:hypothetical protein